MVAISPGEDIQAAVNAHPSGTSFLITAGRHLGQSIRPKEGMSFTGEPGAILDGMGTTRYAFDAEKGPPNVTIRGLVIERYAPPPQDGAIMGKGTEAWTVEDNEVRYNTASVSHKGCAHSSGCGGMGIKVSDRWVVRGNYLHHNDQYGIGGSGESVLIENNEIAHNNHRRAVRTGFGAGGTKFVHTKDLILRGNYVHDNNGNGLWADIDNRNALIEKNRVEANTGNGIMYEISYGGIIRDNHVEGNGFGNPRWLYGAGIMVSSSPDVEVYGNVVKDNARGITAVVQDRGLGAWGRYEVRNLFVHDNEITMKVGWTGLGQTVGDNSYYTSKNNRFEGNVYILGSQKQYFVWLKEKHSLAEWQSYGHDDEGAGSRE